MKERHCDILIVGGGTGAIGAALSALRLGKSVIMSEETDWIGGQLTAQAVPRTRTPGSINAAPPRLTCASPMACAIITAAITRSTKKRATP